MAVASTTAMHLRAISERRLVLHDPADASAAQLVDLAQPQGASTQCLPILGFRSFLAAVTLVSQNGGADAITAFSIYAATLGDQGDLILANFAEYLEGLYQPLQSAESMHVRFANHERAFKFWLRNAGAPWWRTALTPAKSTATLSPFVVADAR